MKLKFEKQSLLKGLLLFALVGNVSFRPALRSLDLASSETMNGAGSVTSAEPQELAPPTPPASAVTASDKGVRPDSPAKPTVAEVPAAEPLPVEKAPRVETPKICGQRFYVTYSEKVLRSETLTEISIKPHTGMISGFKTIVHRFRGGFDTNLDNVDVKKENDETLAKAVKARLNRCADDTPPPILESDREPKEKDSKISAEEKERLKRGIKECRLNPKGEPLSEVHVTRCRLARLDQLDVDDDDRRGKSRAMQELERIIRGDLRKSIKNRLMSDDESKNEEGEELLAETLERLEDLSVDLRLDPRRYAKIKGELESLRTGGQTYRRSVELAKDVKSVRDEMREELMMAQAEARANPRDLNAQRRVLDVQKEILQRQKQLNDQVQMDIVSGPYRTLQAQQNMGYLSSSEFSQFTRPYQTLRQDLLSMLDTRSITSVNTGLGINQYTLPGDFMSYRQDLARSFQRNYGVAVTQRPNDLSLGNGYGMTPNSNRLQLNGSAFSNFAPTAAPAQRRWY